MAELVFDHDRLDEYRVSVEYEYRDAEYEYDGAAKPERSDARERRSRGF